jgi:hypothetical protein
MSPRPLALLLPLLPLLGVPAGAEEAASTAPPVSEYAVKVSLSREDPDMQTGTTEAREYVEFFLFIDGGRIAGAEFGILIDGGELIAYALDPAHAWVPLPMTNAYPGTVSQARAGDECIDPPICLGKMLVKPTTPGGRVALDVTPSERGTAAALYCDLSTSEGLAAYPGAWNGEPPMPHAVFSIDPQGETAPEGAESAASESAAAE